MWFLIEIHIEEIIYLVSKGLMDRVTNDICVIFINCIDDFELWIGVSQVFWSRDVQEPVKIYNLIDSIQSRIEFSNLRRCSI